MNVYFFLLLHDIKYREKTNSHRKISDQSQLFHPFGSINTGCYCFDKKSCLSCDALGEGSHSDLGAFGSGYSREVIKKWFFVHMYKIL